MGRHFNRGPRFQPQPKEPSVRINRMIRAPQVRVIDVTGEQIGILTVPEALKIAEERQLDLVEIAPKANPPVCKIIDFGKYRYEQQKREKIQKKAQHQQQVKEVRFKMGTDTHDFDFKTRHARNFLEDGDKVKAAVQFRGREIVHKDIGIEMLKRFVEALDDIAKVDQEIKMEGNSCTVILSPDKVKMKPAKKPSAPGDEAKKKVKQAKPAEQMADEADDDVDTDVDFGDDDTEE